MKLPKEQGQKIYNDQLNNTENKRSSNTNPIKNMGVMAGVHCALHKYKNSLKIANQ